MKNLVLALCVIGLILSSCSSDSGSNPQTMMPYKIITSFDEGTNFETNDTMFVEYNGLKLDRIIHNNDHYSQFFYEGDLIKQVEVINNNNIVATQKYAYDNQERLVEYLSSEKNYFEKKTFTYLNQNTVQVQSQSSFDTYDITLFIENDEVKKRFVNENEYTTYTYDGKNSPFKNITGYDKIVINESASSKYYGKYQNVLTFNNTSLTNSTMKNNMQYNDQNFPITSSIEITEETFKSFITFKYYY